MSYEQHQPQQQALLNQPIGMLNQQYALASQQQVRVKKSGSYAE